MAKTVKINKPLVTTEANPIVITPESKDTTYVFKNADVAKASVLTFAPSSNSFLPSRKVGSDDLYIFTVEINEQTAKINKVSTTIIKNYYKYASAENPNIVKVGDIDFSYLNNPDKYASYFSGKTVNSLLSTRNFTAKTNTTVNITTNDKKAATVIDLGGNDKYNHSVLYSSINDNSVIFMDLKGNDKYNFKNGSNSDVVDLKGNDKYTTKTAIVDISDLQGNDKYVFADSSVMLVELKGNDTYTLSGTVTSAGVAANLIDASGNDKYTVKNADRVTISEGVTDAMAIEEPVVKPYIGNGGNDSYSVSNTTKIGITDQTGNDKYKFVNVSNCGADVELYYINDIKGKDNYTISGSATWLEINDEAGADTYNVNGSYDKKKKQASLVGYTHIYDSGEAKNTFNLNYAGDTYINVASNSNEFNIKNSKYTEILANSYGATTGKDKYTLTSNGCYNIYDSGFTSDKYTLSKSGSGYIDDYGGDDTYTLDKLNFKFYEDDVIDYAGNHFFDEGGNDTLVLKNTKKSNLVFMSDFYKEDSKNLSYNNTLIIYDKSTQGYAYIKNFYTTDEDNNFNGFDNGKIETIKVKVGSKLKALDVSTNSSYYADLNNVKSNVINWLSGETGISGNNFTCVEDVLMYGSDAQKNTLVACFENKLS